MAEIWLQTCLRLLLVMCCLVTTGSTLRADLKREFKMCPGQQLGRVVAVEADGPGCRKRNGQDLWPCFVKPGRDGIFKISFIHEAPVTFTGITSSIHAKVKVRGVGRFTGEQRVPLKGEVEKNACPDTYYESVEGPYYGCPIQPGVVHTLEKKITVPSQVRYVQANMNVEFKLKNKNGNTIICFSAPIINT